MIGKIVPISSELIQCTECSWIGLTSDATDHDLGGMVCCQSCRSIGVTEYTGPATVPIPVELLSKAITRLIVSSYMLGNEGFGSEMKEAERSCAQHTFAELMVFSREQGIRVGGPEHEESPMKKVKLKNGAEEYGYDVDVVKMALDELVNPKELVSMPEHSNNVAAVYTLRQCCDDPAVVVGSDAIAILKKYRLLEDDLTVSSLVRNVVLSAVELEGSSDVKLSDPAEGGL